jgi:hypothetical protein
MHKLGVTAVTQPVFHATRRFVAFVADAAISTSVRAPYHDPVPWAEARNIWSNRLDNAGVLVSERKWKWPYRRKLTLAYVKIRMAYAGADDAEQDLIACDLRHFYGIDPQRFPERV